MASLVLVALAAPCGAQTSFTPLFDMSQWTTDTYPAFKSAGSLYDKKTPTAGLDSVDLGQLSGVKYSPFFDMSPGAWSFNTYPKFSGSTAGQGTVFGMMAGAFGRSSI